MASERRLFETQEALTAFFSETLGKREERIAPLIEEIYATTRAVGLRPDAIAYASIDEPGTDALTMTFSVAGPYGDVKRLLSGLERSKRFLVVEQVGLSGGSDADPDVVQISITVTNYFRPGSLRPIRAVRDPRSATKGARAAAAPRGEVRAMSRSSSRKGLLASSASSSSSSSSASGRERLGGRQPRPTFRAARPRRAAPPGALRRSRPSPSARGAARSAAPS